MKKKEENKHNKTKKHNHNVCVSNVSACMGEGGLVNEMESCSSSERVQAGVGHQGRGTRFQSRAVL